MHTGNKLEQALNKINRVDIVDKCIYNVELVTDDMEKALAKVQLDQSGFDSLKDELGPSRDTSLRRDVHLDKSYQDASEILDNSEIDSDSEFYNSYHGFKLCLLISRYFKITLFISDNIQSQTSMPKIEVNGNLSTILPSKKLDNDVLTENANVEIIENDRSLTPVNDNNEVLEEITQQLIQLQSTPKPFKDVNINTPPPSPADFIFDKEPPNFVQHQELTTNEHIISNRLAEGMCKCFFDCGDVIIAFHVLFFALNKLDRVDVNV